MKLFPAACIDNFYDNPDDVRNLALSLPFDHELNGTGIWSGEQTRPLNELCPEFFSQFSEKFFSLYYDFVSSGRVEWIIDSRFYKVYPFDNDPSNIKNVGWVHSDHNAILAGIIYLNKTETSDNGTALYDIKPNQGYENKIKLLEIQQHELFKNSKGVLPKDFDEDSYKRAVLENNNMFVETARFANKYNRLVTYDGTQYHAATNTYIPNEPFRLAQVIFVRSLRAPGAPLERVRRVPTIIPD